MKKKEEATSAAHTSRAASENKPTRKPSVSLSFQDINLVYKQSETVIKSDDHITSEHSSHFEIEDFIFRMIMIIFLKLTQWDS